VFPNGLMLGVFNPDNSNAAPNGLFWEPNAVGLSALRICVSQGGSSSGPFTRDAINPTDNFGGGGLARQTITLTLNIAFNTAGVLGIGPNNFGSLIYTKSGDSLSGLTVNQILDAANRALAGMGLPAGHDFSSLASLVGSLNISFHDYDLSSWAASHLSTPMVVVQCASEVPPPDPAHVKASDNCSGPPLLTSLPDIISDQLCPNRYTITRTWIARDACGNTNVFLQHPRQRHDASRVSVRTGSRWPRERRGILTSLLLLTTALSLPPRAQHDNQRDRANRLGGDTHLGSD
jgi:hypothetical protein